MNKYSHRLVAAGALFAAGTFAMAVPAIADHRGDSNFSISLGNVVFGYADGYYDQDRRWHDWSNDDERDWYRENNGQTYYQMSRDQDRDNYRRDWREGRRADWRNGGGEGDFSLSLGNVVFGYSDGYYDNNRRWHGWSNDRERDWYRQNRGPTYYQMGRYDDRDQYRRGWLDGRRNDWRSGGGEGDFSLSLGNVVFGYSDGYYDNNRRWHGWSNDRERDWYRQNRGPTYYQMGRYDDRDQYRRGWLDGRRNDWRSDRRGGDFSVSLGGVVLGYYDGYYDNDRRWHSWRSNNERNWYRQNNRDSYFHMRRNRDRDQYRRGWWQNRRADWRVGGNNAFSISLGNVVFGYSDGYYDNNRRWHDWRNEGERAWYQQNHARTYHQMRRDADNHRNRRDWREGRGADWRDDNDRN